MNACARDTNNEFMLYGAGSVLLGVLIAIIAPRIRPKKTLFRMGLIVMTNKLTSAVFILLLSVITLDQQAHAKSNPEVTLVTDLGEITIELYPEEAPKTVANFLQYAEDGFYIGTIFHRVVPGFVVQGGGMTYDFTLKDTRDPVINESSNGLKNKTATLLWRENPILTAPLPSSLLTWLITKG